MDDKWSGIRNYMHNMKIKWYYIILLYNEFYVISLDKCLGNKETSIISGQEFRKAFDKNK